MEHQPTRDSQRDRGRGWTCSDGPTGQRSNEGSAGKRHRRDGLSMTVKSGAQELTFYIDGQTHLEVRTSARDVQQAQPATPSHESTASSSLGMPVLVRYREENGRNHALNVERVGSAGPGPGASKIADGKVKSVSASHMTIASDGHDVTFAITGDTDVLAKGASKATKAAGGGTPLTTFVHSGDDVSVTYKEAAGAMTASEIRVRIVNR